MQEHIREYALEKGAHLVGFADAEDWTDAPKGFRPKDIMPTAKGVIVLAKSIAAGTVYSNNQAIYTAQHGNIVHDLDTLANDVALFLERNGGTAVPIPTEGPYLHWEEDNQYGRAILSHRHAAVKAGLGVIGKNSLLITPEYGNRVYLVTVLTDIECKTSPPVSQNLCPSECKRCLEICPIGALPGNGLVEQKLCRSNVGTRSARGHSMVNCWKCRAACCSLKI